MLLVLALSSGALAVTQMAAWWVIVPPCVMLTGYLALLRQASKSDAEAANWLAPYRGLPTPDPSAPSADPLIHH